MEAAPDQAHHLLPESNGKQARDEFPHYVVGVDRREQVNNLFTYHAPREDQLPRYNALRAGARTLAHDILSFTPSGPDQSAAIRLLRECVMTANAAIALEDGLPDRGA